MIEQHPIVDVAVFGDQFQRVLADRFNGCAVYGSTVTGGYLPGVSDVDVLVVTDGEITVADASALRGALAGTEGDWSRIQASYLSSRTAEHRLRLAPNSFVAFDWVPPPAIIHTADTLRESGTRWLSQFPRIVESDISDWSVCSTDDEERFERLVFTRIKPTIRAIAAADHPDPVDVWCAGWHQLTDHLTGDEHTMAADITELIASLRETRRLMAEHVPPMLSILTRLSVR